MLQRPSLQEIGQRDSLLGSRFVGLMRWTGGATAAVGLAAGASLGLGALEARFPLVRHFDVKVPARPGLKEVRILHISDLHIHPRQGFIRDFLHRVAQDETFDMVVSTGDNLGSQDGVPLLLEALEPLLSYPGAFVLGSNDYYSAEAKPWASYLFANHSATRRDARSSQEPDLPWLHTVEAMTDAGWLDLTNQSGSLQVASSAGKQTVAMVGLDDPHIKRDRPTPPGADWWQDSSLRLGLVHAPYRRIVDNLSQLGADLVLAGHTHGGQLRLPGWGAIVTNCDLPRRHSRGMSSWTSKNQQWPTSLHVSAGLGTSPYAPVRLFCRPEVSILRVCPTG